MRDTEKGRDTGRGRGRLCAGSPAGLDPQTLGSQMDGCTRIPILPLVTPLPAGPSRQPPRLDPGLLGLMVQVKQWLEMLSHCLAPDSRLQVGLESCIYQHQYSP